MVDDGEDCDTPSVLVLWDDNRITIEGSTDLTFTEDVCKRFESYGWDVSAVEDGDDVKSLSAAMERAKQERLYRLLRMFGGGR